VLSRRHDLHRAVGSDADDALDDDAIGFGEAVEQLDGADLTPASSGICSTSCSPRSTVTLSSMPGRSLRSGLGSTARTVADRVRASRRVSTVVTSPVNELSGQASLRAVIFCPDSTADSQVSGIVKSSLTTDRSSSVVITADGCR